LVYLIESALLMRAANRRERAYSRTRLLHAPAKARALSAKNFIAARTVTSRYPMRAEAFNLIVWNAALFAV
jgi:hypothetical protein